MSMLIVLLKVKVRHTFTTLCILVSCGFTCDLQLVASSKPTRVEPPSAMLRCECLFFSKVDYSSLSSPHRHSYRYPLIRPTSIAQYSNIDTDNLHIH